MSQPSFFERKKRLEEEEEQRKRVALIRPLKIGTRVTVFGYSVNEGDAKVTAQYTGENKDSIAVEYDNHIIHNEVDPREVAIVDCSIDGEDIQTVLKEKKEHQSLKKKLLFENHAMKYKMFLWRGLRGDETGKGLFAKNPFANCTVPETMTNGRVKSQFIHLTKIPEIAIYYAAAFSTPNSPCRIAQIDISKIDIEDIHDFSDGYDLPNQASRFAKSHKVVLIKEHIPAKAVTIRTIETQLSIPRGVRGSFVDFQEMLQGTTISKVICKWRHESLKLMLKREVQLMPLEKPYPSYLLILDRLISECSDANVSESTDSISNLLDQLSI